MIIVQVRNDGDLNYIMTMLMEVNMFKKYVGSKGAWVDELYVCGR